MSTLIIAEKCGQLGNRLFLFAHCIAHAIENGHRVVNPAFDEYAGYFPELRNDLLCRYPLRRSLVRATSERRTRLFALFTRGVMWAMTNRREGHFYRLINIGEGELLMNESDFQEICRSKRWIFLHGYRFRDFEAVRRQAAELRRVFAPLPSIQHNVEEIVRAARTQNGLKENDLLIGVHIRRGDYKTAFEGRYFYDPEDYAHIMHDLVALLSQQNQKRVAFLICSNEELDRAVFAGLNVHFGSGHLVEDMYSFARCDFLIGPPSSYTRWASLIGEVPIYLMEEARAPLSPHEFVQDWNV